MTLVILGGLYLRRRQKPSAAGCPPPPMIMAKGLGELDAWRRSEFIGKGAGIKCPGKKKAGSLVAGAYAEWPRSLVKQRDNCPTSAPN